LGGIVTIETINLAEKMGRIDALWSSRIAAELNDSYVKLVRLRGEFVWHHHDHEDELFLVVKGTLVIRLRDRDLRVGEGELVVIPRGVEHCPVADEEVQVVLIEPKTTTNTGSAGGDRTVADQWV
jgi:mannose-6-phosphate isomerase-like protein (cupin superfamily)